MKTTMIIAVAAFSGVLLADPVKLDTVGQFGKMRGVTAKGDVITVTGPATLLFKEKYTVSPKSKYILSCEVKLPEGAKAAPFLGAFQQYDKDGKEIKIREIMAFPGTDTVLTAPVKAGDQVIKIANGAKWEKASYAFAAFNTKADASDLPNKELVSNVVSVQQDKGFWTVTLQNPVPKDYPAGTGVREHSNGGFNYTFQATPKSEWVKVSGEKTGVAIIGDCKKGWWRSNTLWPCTMVIQPMLTPNWNWAVKNSKVQIRNVTFEEIK